MLLCLVWRSAPITNSFVKFAQAKLTTDRHSSANCTSEFLMSAGCQTAPITMLYVFCS